LNASGSLRWQRTSGPSGKVVSVGPDQTPRFEGTTTTCLGPKGQIRGGLVICNVAYPQKIVHPTQQKFDVGLRLRWVTLQRRSAGARKLLKAERFC
jgi:hypothetical protein